VSLAANVPVRPTGGDWIAVFGSVRVNGVEPVGLLAYNPIRLLLLRSAKLEDVLPRQLCFKHSMQLWLAWSQRGLPADEVHIDHLLALIAQRHVGRRPGRVEPRAVKRRPEPLPLLT
jgi:hypothetical protein